MIKIGSLLKRTAHSVECNMMFWDDVFASVAAGFPKMSHDKQLVDLMTARIVTHPDTLDVLVCSNLFGDILTNLDAASAVQAARYPNPISYRRPMFGAALRMEILRAEPDENKFWARPACVSLGKQKGLPRHRDRNRHLDSISRRSAETQRMHCNGHRAKSCRYHGPVAEHCAAPLKVYRSHNYE
jgi:hypothetical protein